MWGIAIAIADCWNNLILFAQVEKDSKDWFNHLTKVFTRHGSKKGVILLGLPPRITMRRSRAVTFMGNFFWNLHSTIEKLNLTAITPHMQGGVCHNFHQFAILFAPGNCQVAKVWGKVHTLKGFGCPTIAIWISQFGAKVGVFLGGFTKPRHLLSRHHVGCPRLPSRKCLLQRMYNLMHWHVGWGFPKELPRAGVRLRFTRHQNGWSIPHTLKHLIEGKSWSIHRIQQAESRAGRRPLNSQVLKDWRIPGFFP